FSASARARSHASRKSAASVSAFLSSSPRSAAGSATAVSEIVSALPVGTGSREALCWVLGSLGIIALARLGFSTRLLGSLHGVSMAAREGYDAFSSVRRAPSHAKACAPVHCCRAAARANRPSAEKRDPQAQ